jgi:hypothetical protein
MNNIMSTRTHTNISSQSNSNRPTALGKPKKQVNSGVIQTEAKVYTLDEVYERGLDKLSTHYGVDFRKLE